MYMYMYSSVLPRTKGKAYLEGVAWVEPATTSKLLALPNSHIIEKSISKAYWTNIPENTGNVYNYYEHESVISLAKPSLPAFQCSMKRVQERVWG